MVNPKVMDHKRALFEQRNEESALTYPHKPYKLYLNLSGDSKIDKTYIANSDGVGLYRSDFYIIPVMISRPWNINMKSIQT